MICPVKPGSASPGRRVHLQPEAPERALAVEAGDEVVRQADALERRAEHELAGVQDERAAVVDLDQLGQIGHRPA